MILRADLSGCGLLIMVVAAVAPAAALDCSDLEILVCGAPPAQSSIGLWGVDHDGNFCSTGGYVGAHVQAYTFNLDEPQDATLRLTGPAAMHCDLFLLAECDETACLDSVVGNQEEKIITMCLEPGEYFIAMATYVEAILPYELGLECEPCDPVWWESHSWSSFKQVYH